MFLCDTLRRVNNIRASRYAVKQYILWNRHQWVNLNRQPNWSQRHMEARDEFGREHMMWRNE